MQVVRKITLGKVVPNKWFLDHYKVYFKIPLLEDDLEKILNSWYEKI